VYLDLPKDRISFCRTTGILLAAFAIRARVIGDLAGAEFEFLRQPGRMRSFGLAFLSRLFAIRVLGASVAEGLEEKGLTNAVAISNGIADPAGSTQTVPAPDEARRFLYVGKIAESKGIGTLVDFVKAHADSGSRFILEIVGEWESPETEARVLAAVEDLGIGDRIRFLGLLVDDEKWQCYRRADLLLHPSHWDGQPVTILEALAFGVPVVASRVGAIPDTLRSGVDGYLMEEISAAEVARGVDTILTDRETYVRFSVAARASYLERFSATVFEEGMRDLFLSALSPGEPATLAADRVR
jgi:glycosyltransferase involved in cell wall biosynthesis